MILETEIDALDITVLSGGGDEVGEWAVENGFLLTPDAPEVLDFYAERSPVFMAARFDAERAAELGQGAGDSTPIMATIPTDDPWVPLRILGLGARRTTVRSRPTCSCSPTTSPSCSPAAPGLTLERSEQADGLLLDDLRSDVGMEWVPERHVALVPELDAAGRRARLRPGRVGHAGRRRRRSSTPACPSRTRSRCAAGTGPPAWPTGRRRGRRRPVARGLVAGGRARWRSLRRDGRRPRVAAHGRREPGARPTDRTTAGAPTAAGPARSPLAWSVAAAVTAGRVRGVAVSGGDGAAAAAARPRRRDRPGRRRALLFDPDGAAGGRGHPGALRGGQRRPDRPRADRRARPRSTPATPTGTEAEHPSIPGEVSVGPNGTAVTTFTFDEPGTFEFACHLPGHYEYGMHGEVEVVAGLTASAVPAGPGTRAYGERR